MSYSFTSFLGTVVTNSCNLEIRFKIISIVSSDGTFVNKKLTSTETIKH